MDRPGPTFGPRCQPGRPVAARRPLPRRSSPVSENRMPQADVDATGAATVTTVIPAVSLGVAGLELAGRVGFVPLQC